MQLREWLTKASTLPHLDREVLAAFVLNQDRSWLIAHPTNELAPEQLERLNTLQQRAEQGEPMAYITGHKEFFGRNFVVTPATLIPRPESELLIENVLSLLKNETAPLVLDVGTGSGCLAITIAAELPAARVVAIDTSQDALEVAKRNADIHQVADRIDFRRGDLLAPLQPQEQPTLVLANLPYLTPAEGQHSSIAYEPPSALVSGTDGAEHYRRLLKQLSDRGIHQAVFEISPTISATVLSQAKGAGFTGAIIQDLQGLDRVLVLTKKP